MSKTNWVSVENGIEAAKWATKGFPICWNPTLSVWQVYGAPAPKSGAEARS